MFRYVKFIAILLLFLSAALIEAGAEETLIWEDCVKEARKNHPDLISAEESLNQAKANKRITKSNLLPQISSSLSGKTSKTETRDKTDTYSYSISGKELLFDGFKTSSNMRAASENVKAAQCNYKVTSSNVRMRLMTAFVDLLKAQRLIDITGEISKRRRQSVGLVRLRYKAGREHRGSLLTAEADLAQAEFEVSQANRNIDLARRRLIKELGREKSAPIRAKGVLEIKYFNRQKPDFGDIAGKNSSLQELIARKEAARFGLKSAKADFFPQVYASTSVGRSASDWPPETDNWSVGLSLSFPLFEGGSREAEVSKAMSVFNQAQVDEKSGRNSVILAIEETWTNLQDMIDKVEVQKKFLEAAEERARITEAQYSTGLISFDNWIIIEDNLVRVKKSFLDTRTNALIAEAKWIQAKGGTLDYDEE